MGGTIRLGHLDLRRLGGHSHGRRNPGPSGGSRRGVVAGSDLRRGRSADLAVQRRRSWREPMVAGAWMGLAVKTDGAAVAAGGITELLILAQELGRGHQLSGGWVSDRHHHQGVHRHLHRRLGLRAGLHLDQPHRRDRQKARAREIWSVSRSSSSASSSPLRPGSTSPWRRPPRSHPKSLPRSARPTRSG